MNLWIDRYLSVRPDGSEALWVNRRGRRLGPHAIAMAVKVRARACGIEGSLGAHAIRRSVATHLLRAGATPMVVAELLGHRRLETLGRYVGLEPDDLRSAHRKFHPRS